jgi:membrane fusion protein (multidrug efflux system)
MYTQSPTPKTIFLTLFLSLAMSSFVGCKDQPIHAAAAAPALPVKVVEMRPTNVPVGAEWVGTLDGFVNAQIQPQAAGYLVKQSYKEGDQVKKGQVLFEIDPRPFVAALAQAQGQLDQAKGQVQQAEAQLGLAKINTNRDTPLALAHAIAQSQLDTEVQQQAQTQASVSSAKANVAAAEAAVSTAQLNLSFTHVRSLISGVAGQATTQVGNLVNTQSTLTAVSQLDPIKAYFSISDGEYLALTQHSVPGGTGLLKATSGVPLTLFLSDGQAFPQKGRIAFVDRQMNSQTGAIRIAAVFPNPNNVLRPGEFGRITANVSVRRAALLVPQVAIQELQGLEQAYIAGPDGKAHLVPLKLGPQIGLNWLVEAGLASGDQVIVDNLQKIKEGVPVAPHKTTISAPSDSAGS